MAGKGTFKWIDFDGQTAQVSFDTTAPIAGNLVAQEALHDALAAAFLDIILGGAVNNEVTLRNEFAGTKPSTSVAQRNIQWVVTYRDTTTTSEFHVKIPMADISDATLFATGTNQWDPADADWIAFVAAFEAYVLSPAGNAVEVLNVAYVQ